MGYEAMVIGDQDLQLGADVLRQRIAEAEFPVLSANVTLAGKDELLAQPYTFVEVAGRAVGIIGITWDATDLAQDQFVLLKADEVLAKYVAEVAEKADIIIVLSNMGHEDDLRLASDVPGIDLIVGGRTQIPLPQALRDPRSTTLVVQAGGTGQYLGRRTLQIDPSGTVTNYTDELLLLTDEYADDSDMRQFLDSYKVE